MHTVDWDLTAHQENEQSYHRPKSILSERDLSVRLRHLGQHAHDRFDQVKEPHLASAVAIDPKPNYLLERKDSCVEGKDGCFSTSVIMSFLSLPFDN